MNKYNNIIHIYMNLYNQNNLLLLNIIILIIFLIYLVYIIEFKSNIFIKNNVVNSFCECQKKYNKELKGLLANKIRVK